MSKSTLLSIIFLLLALSHCVYNSYASEGDQDPRYQTCLSQCQQSCNSLPSKLTVDLKVTFWTCPQDCQYECMHKNVLEREAQGQPQVKYYGKWPFVRVLGIQELFAFLFSLFNLAAHIYGYYYYTKSVSETYPYRWLWVIYSITNMNLWVWSSVFHARDVPVTEHMDYFSAFLVICFANAAVITRVFNLTSETYHIYAVFGAFASIFIAHVSYLQFVSFDYGFNMKVGITLSIVYTSLWLGWCFYYSYEYSWRCMMSQILLWCFGVFELFDFHPWWGLIDSHSLWHAFTPLVAYLFYHFLVDDANFYFSGSQKQQKLV